ncbi:MAG: polyprenol monophosphomannose synthase [Hadesarchaea archaeon]|nr:polyprenol monophosphomannose synthase [Hadesarchaea archaeon]
MKISVLVPTYNERENLPELLKRISKVFREKKIDGEVIVIDDNSPDGTGELAEELRKKYSFLKVIHRRAKLGLGSAYLEGFGLSSGQLIFTMDSDLSHDPKYLPRFIEAAKRADLVVGTRYMKGGKTIGWGIYRRLVSRGANFLAKLVIRDGVKDVTSGYRAYHRKILERIPLDKIQSSGYAFQLEMMYEVKRRGFKIKSVPITFVDRKRGKSKLGIRDILGFLKLAVKLGLKR